MANPMPGGSLPLSGSLLLFHCRVDPSRLTPSMQEMIVNFLLRMAFVRCVCYALKSEILRLDSVDSRIRHFILHDICVV